MQYTEVATFPSASSSAVYTVKRDENGDLSCNCPGWTFKKEGQLRGCKHIDLLTVGYPQGAAIPASIPKAEPASMNKCVQCSHVYVEHYNGTYCQRAICDCANFMPQVEPMPEPKPANTWQPFHEAFKKLQKEQRGSDDH